MELIVNLIYAHNFADGYAAFALWLVVSAVIGFVFFVIREVKNELDEKKKSQNAKDTAILQNLAKYTANLSIVFEPKFNTYYVFNSDNGQFVTQDIDVEHLGKTINSKFIKYTLKAKNTETFDALKKASNVTLV